MADPDRDAILARRRRFVAAAMSGLGLACQTPNAPASTTPPSSEALPATIVEAEPTRADSSECVWPGDELAPLPPPDPIPFGLEPDELHAAAKQRFAAGQAAYEMGEYDDATVEFEAAWALAPELVQLAYNVAEAAYRGRRWRRAQRFYREWLARAEGVDEGARERVQTRLAELDGYDCRAPRPEPCLKFVGGPERD